jgi:hypothetical protein
LSHASNGRRISSGSAIIAARASASVIVSGRTSLCLIRGEDWLNQAVTGVVPKNGRRRAGVQASASRFRTSSTWPEARSTAICRALPTQPGLPQNVT